MPGKKFFRPFPALTEDSNTSIIRIENRQMEELGIKPGDIVKVTGVRTTGAICMPIDDDYKQQTDSKVTYLPGFSELPQVRMSNVVALNTNNHGPSQVEIEKASSESTIAQTITLRYINPLCGVSLDKRRFEGLVVCNGDRFNHHDNNEKDSVHSCMYWVTGVKPNDFSKVDHTTRIDLISQRLTLDEMKSLSGFPELSQLESVIPIAARVRTDNLNIIFPSIELYDNGARFYIYLKADYRDFNEFSWSNISASLRVKDDKGTLYHVNSSHGGGSSSPNAFNYNWSFIVDPRIDSEASELTITLSEFLIQAPFFPPSNARFAAEQSLMVSPNNQFPDMIVFSGPWEFKVRIR